MNTFTLLFDIVTNYVLGFALANEIPSHFLFTFEFFAVYTKLAEMAVLASKDLTTVKKLPLVGLNLM